MESPELLSDAWNEVLNSDTPALLKAVVAPDAPPMPPHISLEKVLHYAKAIIKGDLAPLLVT